MYGVKTSVSGSAAAAGALPFTGGDWMWLVLAAITLLFAGSALLYLVRPSGAHRP